jgi:putative flippase GtrA
VSSTRAGRQFARFLVVGGVAAIVNYSSRFVFSLWVAFPVAIVLAYGAGMVTAFVLMRRYVFDAHRRSFAPQVWKFVLVNCLAVLQTLAVSLLLARWVLPALGIVWQVEALAHAVGVLVPVATSFMLHKQATFA